LIAVIALVISLFSLWFSWKAYRLNVQTSRAVLQVSTMKLLSDWSWNPAAGATQKPVSIQMTVSNSGKSLANNTTVFLWLNACYESPITDKETGVHLKPCTGSGGRKLLVDNLGPGASRDYKMDLDPASLVLALTHSPDFNGKITDLSISPNFEYSDPTGTYKDDLCFSIRADKRGVIKAGTIYPCNTIGKGTVTLP
jgi:hypothetical protein